MLKIEFTEADIEKIVHWKDHLTGQPQGIAPTKWLYQR
jgi:hypothetical protein